MFRFVRRLLGLGSKPTGYEFDLDEPVLIVNSATLEGTVRDSVIRIVSEVKKVPIEEVTDDMKLEGDGHSIGMNVVWMCGKVIIVNFDSTVGDLIQQAES